MLRLGLETSDVTADVEAMAEAIETRQSTGRPLAVDDWIATQERATQRPVGATQAGPEAERSRPSAGLSILSSDLLSPDLSQFRSASQASQARSKQKMHCHRIAVD